MKIDLLFAGDQRERTVKIRHQFLGRARLAGVISRCLNTAAQRSVGFKTADIVSLPAMNGDGDIGKAGERLFGVYAEGGVCLFCEFVCVHIIFPFG